MKSKLYFFGAMVLLAIVLFKFVLPLFWFALVWLFNILMVAGIIVLVMWLIWHGIRTSKD